MPSNFWFPVVSKPGTNFTEALLAAGSTLTPPFAGSAINVLPGVPPVFSRRYWIRAIEYVAKENVGLEFDFFGSAAGNTTDPATNTFISRYQFGSVNGVQYNGAGLYLYFSGTLQIPYFDLDTANAVPSPNLNVGIQNIDTVAKSADAAGAIACTFWLEPIIAPQG